MLTIKIEWKCDFFPNYSVYTASKYVVCKVVEPSGDYYIQLLLTGDNGDISDIHLGKGTVAYVMNSHGATVDRIYVRD